MLAARQVSPLVLQSTVYQVIAIVVERSSLVFAGSGPAVREAVHRGLIQRRQLRVCPARDAGRRTLGNGPVPRCVGSSLREIGPLYRDIVTMSREIERIPSEIGLSLRDIGPRSWVIESSYWDIGRRYLDAIPLPLSIGWVPREIGPSNPGSHPLSPGRSVRRTGSPARCPRRAGRHSRSSVRCPGRPGHRPGSSARRTGVSDPGPGTSGRCTGTDCRGWAGRDRRQRPIGNDLRAIHPQFRELSCAASPRSSIIGPLDTLFGPTARDTLAQPNGLGYGYDHHLISPNGA